MSIEQILTLSLLQGLTEFLPISSSAHLQLIPQFTDWDNQGLAFDVAVHVGTLLAVVFYFRKDLLKMSRAVIARVIRKEKSEDSRLFGLICLATLPVCLTGFPLNDFNDWIRAEDYRAYGVIAATTIVFGILLGVADRFRGKSEEARRVTVADAIWIGVAQAIAPIPGTSRSGITVTAALFRGLDRATAAKFSFLLSIPTILLAGGYESLKLIKEGESVAWGTMGLGILFSAVAAYLCIHFFLKLIEKIGMMPFVVYRVALAIVLVVFCVKALETGSADAQITSPPEVEASEKSESSVSAGR